MATTIVKTLCLCLTLWLLNLAPVWADPTVIDSPLPDLAAGQLFEIHCAGCHPNGANIIRRGKTLKQRALERNGYGDESAIATLITQGKGLMSAFGEKLSPEQIQTISVYVLNRAKVDWRP